MYPSHIYQNHLKVLSITYFTYGTFPFEVCTKKPLLHSPLRKYRVINDPNTNTHRKKMREEKSRNSHISPQHYTSWVQIQFFSQQHLVKKCGTFLKIISPQFAFCYFLRLFCIVLHNVFHFL